MKTPNRREFIKTTAATAAALASGQLHPQPAAQTLTAPSADPIVLELANEALNAARSGGATLRGGSGKRCRAISSAFWRSSTLSHL